MYDSVTKAMHLEQSIELDVLEETVENYPDSLWSIVERFRYHYPHLDKLKHLQYAKKLVQDMLEKGWVRVIQLEQGATWDFQECPSVWPEHEWEAGTEPELRKFRVVATSLGESVYLDERGNN